MIKISPTSLRGRGSEPLDVCKSNKVPILALEVVSQNYRGEYSTKKAEYAKLGILYYVVYNPFRRRKPRLEVYKLIDGGYTALEDGSPVWLPGIGLGIGMERGTYLGIPREWLYWYDRQGQRLLTPQEQAKLAQQEAQEALRRVQLLAERLRSLGIDPDLI